MSDIPSTIARVFELDAAGTPGPWRVGFYLGRCRKEHKHSSADHDPCVYEPDFVPSDADHVAGAGGVNVIDSSYDGVTVLSCDAALIAYYRTAAPRLARECERLQALALDRWEEAEELRILLGNASQESLEGLVQRAHRDRDTARDVLTRIAATMACEPDDDADLIEAVRLLVAERDKGKAARAEVERLRAGIALVLVSIDDARRLEGDGTVGRQILAGLLAEVPR